MRTRFFFSLLFLFIIQYTSIAQEITGKITDHTGKPFQGANIVQTGTTNGVFSLADGSFTISLLKNQAQKLTVSFVGFQSVTVDATTKNLADIKLIELNELDEVLVSGNRAGSTVSSISLLKTELINETELKKAACCDLSGCFETQATVQPQVTNVITNAKELRILGLSGVYNQLLIDGFPVIQALSYTYGISSYPGSSVGNIHISKGANSVVQGYESISGQINVELKDPAKTDKLFLNLFSTHTLETQFNANIAFDKNNWSNITMMHVLGPNQRHDEDNDTFLDKPLTNRFMVINKLEYNNPKDHGFSGKLTMRYLNESRLGGQMNFDPKIHLGTTDFYGQQIKLNQPEMQGKLVYRINDCSNFSLITSALRQNQNSYFGTLKYDALQESVYSNLQFETDFAERYFIKTGLSYRYLDLTETIAIAPDNLNRTFAGTYSKHEIVPGAFAEGVLHFFDSKLIAIAGARADYLNNEKLIFTPRFMLKVDFTEKSILRLSVGTGWRTVNLFSENIGLLSSSRNIIFEEKLAPEEALNYGINFTQKFETDYITGYVSADYYRTRFYNRFFPDYDSQAGAAIIRNDLGKSIGNGLQTELGATFFGQVETKFAYNFLEVFKQTGENTVEQPFIPKHKFMASVSYKPLESNWQWDINLQRYGEQKLPNTSQNPEEFRRPDYSEAFYMLNTQFTLKLKKFEIYTGCENILNFKQEKAIISWQDPFGKYFDTSSVWGPVSGREFYLGIRFTLPKAVKESLEEHK